MTHRPHIGLRIQRDAALYQLGLDPGTAELDHDPALGLRYFDPITGKYDPDANDPRYLVWRDPVPHADKTFKDNGSGRSDITAIAHAKRVVKKHAAHTAKIVAKLTGEATPKPDRRKRIQSKGFDKTQTRGFDGRVKERRT